MRIHELAIQYGFKFILYASMIGLVQSLCVFWIAAPYLKPRRNPKLFFAFLIFIFSLHDTFWSLFGYSEGRSGFVLGVELFVFALSVHLSTKYLCSGSAFQNFCYLIAIEWWYQILSMIFTFPIYIPICNFNLEEASSFLNIPSLRNVVFIWIVYFLTAWAAKRIWNFMYNHRGRYYDAMCLCFCVLDIGGLLFAGWRIITIAFLAVVYIILFSFLQQGKNEKALKEQFCYYQKLAELQKQREKEISVIRHDIANHLNVMEKMKRDEEGQRILKKIDKKTRNFTGIPVLDCLLCEKERQCEKEGIEFVKEGGIFEEIKISEYELVSLFANLLDNAIEAAKNAEKKKVSIDIKKQQGFLKIVVKNTKLSTQKPVENNFKTTKKDKKRHGIGNYIIRNIVELKGGRINYYDEGDSMSIVALLEM